MIARRNVIAAATLAAGLGLVGEAMAYTDFGNWNPALPTGSAFTLTVNPATRNVSLILHQNVDLFIDMLVAAPGDNGFNDVFIFDQSDAGYDALGGVSLNGFYSQAAGNSQPGNPNSFESTFGINYDFGGGLDGLVNLAAGTTLNFGPILAGGENDADSPYLDDIRAQLRYWNGSAETPLYGTTVVLIPEPASLALLGLVGGIALARRRARA